MDKHVKTWTHIENNGEQLKTWKTVEMETQWSTIEKQWKTREKMETH